MSRSTVVYFLALCAVVLLPVTGCLRAQNESSGEELAAKLHHALIEEMDYVSDIRVLKFISFENRNFVLYYYKVGQMENEHLMHFEIINDRVVLDNGPGNMIIATEEEQLTVSGYAFSEPSATGEENWIYLVYGHSMNPKIRKVEVDFIGGEIKSQEIDGLGGYIIPIKVQHYPGFIEIRGLDKDNNVAYRFP
ncbi:MAG: hypothetical protein WBH65_02065 [Dethiobacteria bacterium]